MRIRFSYRYLRFLAFLNWPKLSIINDYEAPLALRCSLKTKEKMLEISFARNNLWLRGLHNQQKLIILANLEMPESGDIDMKKVYARIGF